MAGSSPVRGPSKRDKEVMGLARRARGLGEEVRDLSTASEMDDVEGFLRRSQALKDDVASSKAIEGIKVCSFWCGMFILLEQQGLMKV